MFKRFNVVSGGFILLMGGCGTEGGTGSEVELSGYALEAAVNPAGIGESAHTSGVIDRTNPFFQALGANLRTCETCHAPGQGWTISANATKRLFDDTLGLSPVFMIHDAGGAATMDISTLDARKAAFATTVDRGVIRFTRTISPTAEFLVAALVDPNVPSPPLPITTLSSFRRPSPTANESKVPATGWAGGPTDPFTQVASTSIGATRGHEQRVEALPTETVNAMRDFQIGVVFAQSFVWLAGRLDDDGAKGGAENLLAQPFYVGINDIQGNDPMGHPFTRKVFDLFDAWASNASAPSWQVRAAARGAIYRGQEIFNNREFDISGVAGLNDVLGQAVVRGTCSTCHNAPNVGSHSVFRQFDIGSADEQSCGSDLPLITLENKTTHEQRKTCDMGRATGTGLWSDLGKFRAPPLRGLAARAPYFHDGQIKDIKKAIKYFDDRFNIHFSSNERKDLEAFLEAL